MVRHSVEGFQVVHQSSRCHDAEWDYDHPLELGCGVIGRREQVVQLIMDAAGMTGDQTDEATRASARPNNEHLIGMHRERLLEGAQANGVPLARAENIFSKINGRCIFSESHSRAFAITAYRAAWLKRYLPLVFCVTLSNNRPMGFYPFETLKHDARRSWIPSLNPCINRVQVRAVPDSRRSSS